MMTEDQYYEALDHTHAEARDITANANLDDILHMARHNEDWYTTEVIDADYAEDTLIDTAPDYIDHTTDEEAPHDMDKTYTPHQIARLTAQYTIAGELTNRDDDIWQALHDLAWWNEGDRHHITYTIHNGWCHITVNGNDEDFTTEYPITEVIANADMEVLTNA